MENTVVREGEVYGVLQRNMVNTEMSYLLISSKGAIEIWMKEIESYITEMVDEGIRFMNPQYLCELLYPAHIWNFEPHNKLT
jgi:hypothetical protein